MAYLSVEQLNEIGFKHIGENVQISDKAAIYNPELIEISDHCRIDDFCIVSGRVSIRRYCHITPMCLLAGGEPGIEIGEFSTLAYGVKVFAQSDDYSGKTMVNSLIPKKYKNEVMSKVLIGRHCVLGTNSIVMPGVIISEGTSSGAMTLFNKDTSPWGIYVGSPAKRMKDRSQDLLKLEVEFNRESNDTI